MNRRSRFLKTLKPILRFIARSLLVLFVLLVLLLLLIQIPAVQQRLTTSLENYLENTLQTEVALRAIRLRLPESLVLQGLYVEDQQQQPLLEIGELELNFRLNKLLSKQIQFDHLGLSDGMARMYMGLDSTNYDFIIEAFSGPKTPVDSTATVEPPGEPWVLTFAEAGLALQGIDFQLTNIPDSLFVEANIGQLDSRINQLDYVQHLYQVEQLALGQSQVSIAIGETNNNTTASDTSASPAYRVEAAQLNLDQVQLELTMRDLGLETTIGSLDAQNTQFNLTDTGTLLKMAQLELSQGALKYDQPTAPPIDGFDPQHLDFQQLEAQIDSLEYQESAIKANILALSGQAAGGLNVEQLKMNFDLSEEGLKMEELALKTDQSTFNSTKTHLLYPFLEKQAPPLSTMRINSDLVAAFKTWKDLRYFYPALDSISLFQGTPTPLSLTVDAVGDLKKLQVNQLQLKGWQSQLQASGTLGNLNQAQAIALDLTINKLQTKAQTLRQLLPPGSLPAYVQLPDSILLSGSISGDLQACRSSINAQTLRRGSQDLTQIRAKAQLRHLNQPDSLYLDVQLDTFRTFKSDLLAYLPPNSLPAYVNLPDRFTLTGDIKGYLSALQPNLRLLSYRQELAQQLNLSGNILGLLGEESPSFDIQLDAADISRQELLNFLPDSLLPAYLNLPFINKLSGIFKGDLSDFKTQFALESNSGTWTIDAQLQKEAYALDLNIADLKATTLIQQEYLDSIGELLLAPWAVDLQLRGQGFDFSTQSFADFLLTVKNSQDSSMTGLMVKGELKDQSLRATAVAEEKEIRLQANFDLDYTRQLPKTSLFMDIAHLDLQALQLSDQPIQLQGRLRGELEGYTLDTLSSQLLLSDWRIQYGDRSERVDSLALLAQLDNGQNSLRIQSDFFNAELEGVFRFPSVQYALQQQVNRIWPISSGELPAPSGQDAFQYSFELLRPELLTLGYLPQLKALSPLQFAGAFDSRKEQLSFNGQLEEVQWEAFHFYELAVDAGIQGDSLRYQIQADEAVLSSLTDLLNVRIDGGMKDRRTQNSIQLLDGQQKPRYALHSSARFTDSMGIYFSLLPRQLLNYEDWEITYNNQISWLEGQLGVSNWRLSKAGEAISIRELADGELQLFFESFDLNTLSDMVKLNSNYLGGIANGSLSLRQPFDQLAFNADLRVDSLQVLQALLGQMNLSSNSGKDQRIAADLRLLGNGNDLRLNGHYDLKSKLEPIDFALDLQHLNLPSVEPLLATYLENLQGDLAGDLQITGSIDQPALVGKVQLKDAALGIKQLKTQLRLGTQPIVFDANAIEFKDLEVLDVYGNKGIASSFILTENYQDFFFQSDISIKDFLVLNTEAEDNELYYGKLLVDATASLRGNIFSPTIEVTASPQKESNLTYVYNDVANQIETGEGIVEFVVPEDKQENKASPTLSPLPNELQMKVAVKMSVDEKLNFKIITNPLTGDYFEGQAKGDLFFVMNPDGSMELNGELQVVKGDYLFSYQQLIRRRFEVKPGGTVVWRGDPYSPELALNVLYNVRASAYPLIANQSDSENNNGTSIKQLFVVNLGIGGTPLKTEISTAIEYPSAEGNIDNADIRRAINNINSDPSQQNTQAFSLILFNGFIAQTMENTDFQVVDLSGNINNVITQQLNGLANKYIKFVELDFGLDSYKDANDIAQTDFKVSVRKRLLNNRLTISLDGKTSTERGTDDSESQTYLDNITVEYALTPDGRFRIKVYNQREFDDFIGGTGLKVGGALVFSKDFSSFRIFQKKNKN
ncbi:MAG: translocation/assembly module TamB domain-containing protein [Bacteroidota bacterium]